MTADIIILGAGLTGLTLAKILQDQGKDFLVLEARDRIGGRIHTMKQTPGLMWNVEPPGSFLISKVYQNVCKMSR